MKKVLITGKNSYIGNSLEKWLLKEPNNYKIDKIDLKNKSWRESDFSIYDVVFHVAGIAHIKETPQNRKNYFEVNRDLAFETALKSKNEKVKQFIFLSSMSVYGVDEGIIDKNTKLKPKSAYGQSKIEAENMINMLQDEDFLVSIIRPPMVYGKGCKGNFRRLSKFAIRTPFFPKVNNKRSMIYIDNLSEFVKLMMVNESRGVFFPQNAEYVNVSEMVKLISEYNGEKIKLTKAFNFIFKIINVGVVNKVIGDLVYDLSLSNYVGNYITCEFRESIKMSKMEES